MLYPYSEAGRFEQFVGNIKAQGGADWPEDIMGGFKVVFKDLSWRDDATKVR